MSILAGLAVNSAESTLTQLSRSTPKSRLKNMEFNVDVQIIHAFSTQVVTAVHFVDVDGLLVSSA